MRQTEEESRVDYMIFVNLIKMSFTDLFKSTYQNSIWYNDDKSGFVYSSEKEKHELVFYPVYKEEEQIEDIEEKLIYQLWKKNLLWNILPFPIALIFMALIFYIVEPYGWQLSIAAGIIGFMCVLYLTKLSLSIISTAMTYQIFMNDNFRILPVYNGVGKYSNSKDEDRARKIDILSFNPVSNNSEILANSHFVEVRIYEEKNIVNSKNDSRGTTTVENSQ